MPRPEPPTDCPCDGIAAFAACCGRYLGGAAAPSAAALMRSRYTAYTLCDTDYLLSTWHPDTRPATLDATPALRWLGLRIIRIDRGEPADTTGTVEFVARYRAGGRATRIHEISQFERYAGRWVYHHGTPPRTPR